MAGEKVESQLTVSGCDDGDQAIDHLEHVQVEVQLEHSCRGEVSLVLVSPAGTKSQILSWRPLDNSSEGISFTFMTVHHWGEGPAGTWTLEVEDRPRNSTMSYSRRRGRVVSWKLILYGVSGDRPNHHSSDRNSNDEVGRGAGEIQKDADSSSEQARHVGSSEVKELMEEEEASSDSVKIQSKDEMAKKQNTRRRKWLLEKGFDPEDVDFLIALFETEEEEKRKSAGENSPEKQSKSEIPDYRRNRHYWNVGSSEKRGSWWARSYGTHRRSSSSKRSAEGIGTDVQRIVDEGADRADDMQSLRAAIDELSAILEDE